MNDDNFEVLKTKAREVQNKISSFNEDPEVLSEVFKVLDQLADAQRILQDRLESIENAAFKPDLSKILNNLGNNGHQGNNGAGEDSRKT